MPPNNAPLLEICVDDAAGLALCRGVADRVELCSALTLGGLTPAPGLLAQVAQAGVPVHAMIRPEAAGFETDARGMDVMEADIEAARQAGCAGVVLGLLDGDALDLPGLRRLARTAEGLEMTLHRAVDLVADAGEAVAQAIDLGFSTILSSGGALRASEGVPRLAQMQDRARGQLRIMAGSGITADSIAQIAAATGITAFHASASVPRSLAPELHRMGFVPDTPRRTDAGKIAALRAVVDRLEPAPVIDSPSRT